MDLGIVYMVYYISVHIYFCFLRGADGRWIWLMVLGLWKDVFL
jgi:hypothetical protein